MGTNCRENPLDRYLSRWEMTFFRPDIIYDNYYVGIQTTVNHLRSKVISVHLPYVGFSIWLQIKNISLFHSINKTKQKNLISKLQFHIRNVERFFTTDNQTTRPMHIFIISYMKMLLSKCWHVTGHRNHMINATCDFLYVISWVTLVNVSALYINFCLEYHIDKKRKRK